MAATPSLSALRDSQSTASNRVRGNGAIASRPSPNRSETVLPSRQCARPANPSQRDSSHRADCRSPSTLDCGTMRLRRRNPTAFSTLPFSRPLYGLQNRASTR